MSTKNKPCYKCGQGGHWAKDCTTPRELWISKEQSDALKADRDATATTTATTRDDDDDAGEDANDARDARTEKRKSNAGTTRKPKFSVHDHLLGPNGLGALYREFPGMFAARAKGEGHEEHDVHVLLTMYKEWAVKMYPYAPAEETLARVDKLQSDKSVKMAVREFNELDFGGGVGEAVHAMERGDAVDGYDVEFPDDEPEAAEAEATDGNEDANEDVDFPDDEVDYPDDDEIEEKDYVFDDDEDEDAARAMQEAEASGDDGDDDDDDDVQGKRGKKIKGATESTKNAFDKLAKKLGKDVSSADNEGVTPTTAVLSPQRKILRVRPKILDASSDEENEPPSEPARRRRAVHGMDDDDDE